MFFPVHPVYELHSGKVRCLFDIHQMLLFPVTDIRFQFFLRECAFKRHLCQHTNGLRGVFIKRNQA